MERRRGGKKVVCQEGTRQLGIHPHVKVLAAGEEVRDGIGSTGDVFKGIVEVLEEFYPPSLSPCDLLRFTEVLEIFMISEHSDGGFCSQKERTAAFETKDNTC